MLCASGHLPDHIHVNLLTASILDHIREPGWDQVISRDVELRSFSLLRCH